MIRGLPGMAIGLAIAALAAPVAAQGGNCAPRADVLALLSDRYGETRQSIGLVSQGQVMELFASEESGSWTIAVTLPNGLTCLMAAGEAYEALAEAAEKGDNA